MNEGIFLYHQKNKTAPTKNIDMEDLLSLVNGPVRNKRLRDDTGELNDEDHARYEGVVSKYTCIQNGLKAWLSGTDVSPESDAALREMIERSDLEDNHALRSLERIDDLGGQQDVKRLSKMMKNDEDFKSSQTAQAPKQSSAALKVRSRRVRVGTVTRSS